jgi:hypothetical protein
MSAPKPRIKPKADPQHQRSEPPLHDPPSHPERDPPVFNERDPDTGPGDGESVVFREDDRLR